MKPHLTLDSAKHPQAQARAANPNPPTGQKARPRGAQASTQPRRKRSSLWLRRSLTSSNNAAISHPNRGLRGIGRGAEVRSAGEGEYLRHGGGQGTGANGKRSFASGGGRSPARPSKVRIWGGGRVWWRRPEARSGYGGYPASRVKTQESSSGCRLQSFLCWPYLFRSKIQNFKRMLWHLYEELNLDEIN